MRKAVTLAAVALTSTLALGAAAPAFAATTSPSPSASQSPDRSDSSASLALSAASGKPGEAVKVTVKAPKGSTALSVSSKALADVRLSPAGEGTWTGTAKMAEVADGTYGVSLTGSGPDGAKLRATAQLTVKAAVTPPAPVSSLKLSKDSGRPGDKIGVTVKTAADVKSAYVSSDAFGGRVDLSGDGHGTWTGTAVVAKGVKTGYYGVHAFAGGKEFDTVKFSTEAGGGGGGTPDVKPVTPLKPDEHKKPKGSVNTGQAPADTAAPAGPADAAEATNTRG
ncbi:hypothetical protein EDE04_3889 [Streptomyces sp. 2132.2]|uniref:hypothetical protein n=1 Tax=Streptomyces sp. 2132.2 TaxID=2485161 RepID=UPI000F474255|nr:hypothetical protein [Streptomyces sp. 2132.2]ROQ97391.1 hypothetical protein EDE04_3889 [Streptomyces sp. 2132.2]